MNTVRNIALGIEVATCGLLMSSFIGSLVLPIRNGSIDVNEDWGVPIAVAAYIVAIGFEATLIRSLVRARYIAGGLLAARAVVLLPIIVFTSQLSWRSISAVTIYTIEAASFIVVERRRSRRAAGQERIGSK